MRSHPAPLRSAALVSDKSAPRRCAWPSCGGSPNRHLSSHDNMLRQQTVGCRAPQSVVVVLFAVRLERFLKETECSSPLLIEWAFSSEQETPYTFQRGGYVRDPGRPGFPRLRFAVWQPR